MQILPSVNAGRGVHHRGWPRAGASVSTRGSGLRNGAVGGFLDNRRKVFVVVLGWRRVGLARVDFGEGWVGFRRLSGMREARFEAGAQIPKSSHLARAPSFSARAVAIRCTER